MLELLLAYLTIPRAMASSCALLELSDDALEVICCTISNPLLPAIACTLAVCCRNLCRMMQVPLAALKERHEAALVFANKVGSSCTELLEEHCFFWHNKDLTPDDVSTLGMLLSSCALPRLTQLRLSGNNLGDAGVHAFCAALGSGAASHLPYLNLKANNISHVGATAIASAIARGALPKLEVLELSMNKLDDQDITTLAVALRGRPALRKLHLHRNSIGDAGVAALVGNLGERELKKLEWLNLGWNQIGDAGCETLVDALYAGTLPAMGFFSALKAYNPVGGYPVLQVPDAYYDGWPSNPASEAANRLLDRALEMNIRYALHANFVQEEEGEEEGEESGEEGEEGEEEEAGGGR